MYTLIHWSSSQLKLFSMVPIPNHIKYTWNVMPFGPLNAPPVYITLMLQLRSIWTCQALEHPTLKSEFHGSSQIVDDTPSGQILFQQSSRSSKLFYKPAWIFGSP